MVGFQGHNKCPLFFVLFCPRKISDKEQSDVNEFLECHIVHIVKPFFRLHHSSAEKEGKGEQSWLEAATATLD